MTVWELYEQLRSILEENGNAESARLEARELAAKAAGCDRHNTIDWKEKNVTPEQSKAAGKMIIQRLKGKPIAYILEEWDFYGYTLRITPDVLIPRSDTEILCDEAVKHAKKLNAPHILDLCCGSGCIGIAIANEVPSASVIGADISEKALEIAEYNAKMYSLEAPRYQTRLANVHKSGIFIGSFDIIVSNPPYITEKEMQELDISVKKYEPELALYGGRDGMDFYRSIAIMCSRHAHNLKPGGRLMVECGWRQAKSVMNIFRLAGLERVESIRDLAGIERVVSAYLPSKRQTKEEL